MALSNCQHQHPPPLKPSNQEKMIDNKKKKYQVDYMATEEAIPM
jgi:hypothetical protein